MKRVKVKILIFLLLFIFLNGCKTKKELKLEEKRIVREISQQSPENSQEEKNNLSLEPKFAEGAGRVNPFIQPYETQTGGGVISTPGGTFSSPTQFPAKIPAQIPPLPQQVEEEKPTLEIPKWPTQPSVLAAGPRSNIASLFNFKLTGIVYDTEGKRKYAIIQETLQAVNPAGTTTGGGTTQYRSYVVKEGDLITDYKIKVKKITPNKVILTRGNQKIDLALVESPKPLLLPTFGKTQASEVR